MKILDFFHHSLSTSIFWSILRENNQSYQYNYDVVVQPNAQPNVQIDKESHHHTISVVVVQPDVQPNNESHHHNAVVQPNAQANVQPNNETYRHNISVVQPTIIDEETRTQTANRKLYSAQKKVFKCNDCPFEASRSINLKNHTKHHKPTDETTDNYLKCCYCTFCCKKKICYDTTCSKMALKFNLTLYQVLNYDHLT